MAHSFFVDGLLQFVSAWIVRYRRWTIAISWGVVELMIVILFYQLYPTHYVGTLPYCLGLFLIFGGMNMISLATRVRHLVSNPALRGSRRSALLPDVDMYGDEHVFDRAEWDPPASE